MDRYTLVRSLRSRHKETEEDPLPVCLYTQETITMANIVFSIETTSWRNPKFPRGYFSFSREEWKNSSDLSDDSSEVSFDSSEVSFDSSEVFFLSSRGNRNSLGSYLGNSSEESKCIGIIRTIRGIGKRTIFRRGQRSGTCTPTSLLSVGTLSRLVMRFTEGRIIG